MPRAKIQPESVKLAGILDLIAREFWRGLPALKNAAPPPELEKLDAFFREHDITEPSAETVLNLWPCITAAVKMTREEMVDSWEIYESFLVRSAIHRQAWGKRGVVDILSEKFGVSPFQLRKIVKEVPLIIAQFVGKISE